MRVVDLSGLHLASGATGANDNTQDQVVLSGTENFERLQAVLGARLST